eukprot:273290-Chlamydomonas_euryale.AAC.1
MQAHTHVHTLSREEGFLPEGLVLVTAAAAAASRFAAVAELLPCIAANTTLFAATGIVPRGGGSQTAGRQREARLRRGHTDVHSSERARGWPYTADTPHLHTSFPHFIPLLLPGLRDPGPCIYSKGKVEFARTHFCTEKNTIVFCGEVLTTPSCHAFIGTTCAGTWHAVPCHTMHSAEWHALPCHTMHAAEWHAV